MARSKMALIFRGQIFAGAYETKLARAGGGSMKRVFVFVVGGLLISSLTCATVSAQATAQISGTAKDQSGAVLPGVEITVTQTETGVARTAVTNETGS